MTNLLNRLFLFLCVAAYTIVSSSACPIWHALVIGLGQYEDTNWSKINGDNDVSYVVKLLEQCGYTDVKTLKNQNATKNNILSALNNLIGRCNLGDRVYIHYSGHGQLMTDLNGDEATRWDGWHSQWDESIIPYDAYMTYCDKDRGEKHISDDELSYYLTKIRNVVGKKGEIIVVIDACHSGDATMGDMNELIRGVDTKFNIPKVPNAPTVSPLPEQWLTISACQPYQLCTEIKEKRVGKLTFALYSLGRSFFELEKEEMESHLKIFLKKYEGRLPQTPMVSGRK